MKIKLKAQLIVLALLFVGCSFQHDPKESVNLKEYKGAVLCGRQHDWNSTTIGAELVSFKRNDSIWTESYIKSVWQSYDVGDTIK
jgi:PBP1b-binding outer membrane lipoprotein LpoB